MSKFSKVVGFGLVNKKSEYLYLEQVSSLGIEVYTRENSDGATLFDTEEKAERVGLDIIRGFGNDKWEYMALDEDFPVSVVKVTKIIEEEEVSRFA